MATPTLAELTTQVRQDLGAEGVSQVWIRRTFESAIATVLAGVLWMFYRWIDAIVKQCVPSTATGIFLDAWAAVFGLTRTQPAVATGAAVITGLTGSTQPAGSILVGPEGQEYTTDVDVTMVGNPGEIGAGYVDLTASGPGDEYNVPVATPLIVSSPATGIQTDALAGFLGITGGKTAETDDELRKRCSAVYEKFGDADKALRRIQTETDQVRTGERDHPPPPKTFDELADYWIENRLPRQRAQDRDVSVLKCHLRPAFGPLLLTEITLERVDALVRSRRHLSPHSVHNFLTLLIAMLNGAVDLGWLRSHPRIRKPRISVDEFTYLKTEDEVRRFLAAAKAEGPVVLAMYATAVYTGMRAGELCGLRWEDVSLDRRLICVRRTYDKVATKNGDIRHVPILDPLLPVLREWRLQNPHPYVFPNEHGGMNGPSARITQEILQRVLAAAEFPPKYITFHDLRHTFSSHWMMRGGDIFRLQKVLGHKSPQMTQRYAHLSPDVFVEDYGRLADLVPQESDGTVLLLPGDGEQRMESEVRSSNSFS